MKYLGKLALLAAVLAGSAAMLCAQEQGATAPDGNTPQQAEKASKPAAPAGLPAGWSLSAAVTAMTMVDTNPVMSPKAESDTGEMFMGRFDMSRVGARSSYRLSYVPATVVYHHFSDLDSTTHELRQVFGYKVSKRDNFSWDIELQKYPSWAGNSLSGSSMGALILAMAGIKGTDLTSETRSARTGLSLVHEINQKSELTFSAGAGVVRYTPSSKNPLAQLFVNPSSNTWYGEGSVAYDYKLDQRRSFGVGAGHANFYYTAQGQGTQVDSVNLRYRQRFQNQWTVFVSAGPSFVSSHGQTGRPTVDVHATVDHAGKSGNLNAEVEHSFYPGLAPGSLTSWRGSVSYQRALSRRWLCGVFFRYEKSGGAELKSGAKATNEIYMGAVQVGYRLSRHVTWFGNYGYARQSGLLSSYEATNRHQFMTGLSFEFDNFFRR